MPLGLIERVERVARRYVADALPSDPSGELQQMGLVDLLMVYGNWRGRFVKQLARTVHISSELGAELATAPPWRGAVESVVGEIERGEDLTARLSKDVRVAYVPGAARKTGGGLDANLDAVLAHDGLHHLHIAERDGGDLVPRGGDLLFAAFRGADAYVIGVYPHGAWGRREMLERMVRNWPKAELIPKLTGMTLASPEPTDDERWQLMKAGVSTMIEIDGEVYAPLGQTTARTPMEVTRRAQALSWQLTDIREHGVSKWLTERGCDTSLYWRPMVRDGLIGLESSSGFVPLGELE